MPNTPDRWQADRLLARYPGTYPLPSEYTHLLPDSLAAMVLLDDADELADNDLGSLVEWIVEQVQKGNIE